MKITEEQFEKIEKYLPKQRGNVKISHYDFINAILYVVGNSYKWRALPKEFGNWHTIYVRMNRWSKNGVLEKLFEVRQKEGLIKVSIEVLCLDSTSVKVRPDGTDALKKEANKILEDQEEALQPKFIWFPHLIEQQYTSGNRHDAPARRDLLDKIIIEESCFLLIDRAYEGDKTRNKAIEQGFTHIVPPKKNRIEP